ncbi:hypothetical protein Esti_004395 [Eimeria stiedai]
MRPPRYRTTSSIQILEDRCWAVYQRSSAPCCSSSSSSSSRIQCSCHLLLLPPVLQQQQLLLLLLPSANSGGARFLGGPHKGEGLGSGGRATDARSWLPLTCSPPVAVASLQQQQHRGRLATPSAAATATAAAAAAAVPAAAQAAVEMESRSPAIPSLLQQMADLDMDKRLMAASDLTQAIVSDPGGLGSAWESRAATAFLQQLGDTSIDVQANAVRCVSRVLLYFLPESVRLILASLATAAADGGSPGLSLWAPPSPSGLLPELPRSMASTMMTVVLPPLMKGVRSGAEDVQRDCLELLADVFSLFGGLNEAGLFGAVAAKEAQLSVHLTQLLHAKLPTARRAARCLGGLAGCLPPSELEELLVVLVSASPLTPAPLEALGEVCRCCSSSSSSQCLLVRFLNPLCCYLIQVLARVLVAEAAASGGSGSVVAAELATPIRRFPELAKTFVAPLAAQLERDEHCIVLQVIELLRRFVRAAATSSPLVLQCETALLLEALQAPTAAAAAAAQQQQQHSYLLRSPELRTGADELQEQMPFLVLRACRLSLDYTLGFKVQQAAAALLLEAAATFAAAAAPLLPLVLAAANGLLRAEVSGLKETGLRLATTAIIIYAFQLQQQQEQQQLQQELLQRQVLLDAAAKVMAWCMDSLHAAVFRLRAAALWGIAVCSSVAARLRGSSPSSPLFPPAASEALKAISQQLHTAEAEGPVLEADLYAFGALMRCYGSQPNATAAAGDAWGQLLNKLEGTGLRKAALASLLMILEADPPVKLEALLSQPPSRPAAEAAPPAAAVAAAAASERGGVGGLEGLAALLAAAVQQQQRQHLRATAASCLLLLLQRHPSLLQEAEQQLNVVRAAAKLLQPNDPVPAATGLRLLLLLLQQQLQQQQQPQVMECLLQQCLPAAVALAHAQPLPQQTLNPLCLFFEALCPPQANLCSEHDLIQRLLTAAKPGAPEGSLQAASVIASRLLQHQDSQQATSKLLNELKQQQHFLLQKQQQLHQQGQQEQSQSPQDATAYLQLSFLTSTLAECARIAACSEFVSEALSCCKVSLEVQETDVQQHATAAISRILSGHVSTCLPQFLLLLQQQRQQVLQAEEASARIAAACNNDQELSAAAAAAAAPNAAAAAEAPVAANSVPAADTVMQQERDGEQQQKHQELAAAKANKKQQRARELLLVSALHGCLLDTDKQQQSLQHGQPQQQAQQQQQQQESEPISDLGDVLSELVKVLSLLAASRSERERVIVAECLILLIVRCCNSSTSSSTSSSCCCSKNGKASSWCDCCSSIHAALLSLLKGDNPEQRLTALASVRHAAARDVILPVTLKTAFLKSMDSNDLRVQRAALMTVGCIYTSAPSSIWGLPAEADVLASHLLKAVEVREELITQVNMGPFKHKIDNGIRLRKTAFVSLTQLARAAAAAAAAAGSTTTEVPLATLMQAVARGVADPSDEVPPLACELLSTVTEYIHCWEPRDVFRQVNSLCGPVEAALSSLSALCLSEQSTKNPQAAERARDNLRYICRTGAVGTLVSPAVDMNPGMTAITPTEKKPTVPAVDSGKIFNIEKSEASLQLLGAERTGKLESMQKLLDRKIQHSQELKAKLEFELQFMKDEGATVTHHIVGGMLPDLAAPIIFLEPPPVSQSQTLEAAEVAETTLAQIGDYSSPAMKAVRDYELKKLGEIAGTTLEASIWFDPASQQIRREIRETESAIEKRKKERDSLTNKLKEDARSLAKEGNRHLEMQAAFANAEKEEHEESELAAEMEEEEE